MHYADEGYRSYSPYHLPSDPMACPTVNEESVCVRDNILCDDSDLDSDSDQSDSSLTVGHAIGSQGR